MDNKSLEERWKCTVTVIAPSELERSQYIPLDANMDNPGGGSGVRVAVGGGPSMTPTTQT